MRFCVKIPTVLVKTLKSSFEKSEKFEKIQLFWKKGINIESFKCGYS